MMVCRFFMAVNSLKNSFCRSYQSFYASKSILYVRTSTGVEVPFDALAWKDYVCDCALQYLWIRFICCSREKMKRYWHCVFDWFHRNGVPRGSSLRPSRSSSAKLSRRWKSDCKNLRLWFIQRHIQQRLLQSTIQESFAG